MRYQINGYTDMFTVISNERKIGGAIEIGSLKLRSGEEFKNVVVTRLEMINGQFGSLGFVTEEDRRYIVHISEISMISDARHVHACNLQNELMRERKLAERIRYLKRLCELNEGSCTLPFQEEAALLVEDIGLEVAKQHVQLSFLPEILEGKVIRIA